MKSEKSLYRLLLIYAVSIVTLFIVKDDPAIFTYSLFALGVLALFLALRIGDVNIATIIVLVALSPLAELIIFGFGLVDLRSSDGDRLIQNSIIFGTHFVIDVIVLVPMTYRVEISKKLFPIAKIKYNIADSLLPWVQLIGIFVSVFALVENYLRNAKDYDIAFFFYSFSISGYIVYSFSAILITILLAMAYKDYYGFKTPTLLSRSSKRL
ncbi:hypothetical protein J8L98_05755 [Pseudoalteromonas sp. MMG013]|uniref:Uncharacterized protein n=1 Tax=Pseudoalteromonas aurantia 208 TaxID=1314867 RepID=A0ABR9EH79_9GAMM|nr:MULTISPECIES: hypothetical protein [Pseudoalteromonas]MBE0369575.1 hypothetical protein [Pseudoalteromonas aurantia 208]MBQ4844112.1 hypothetical protein [Pseudoalteromonas sp. MMG005]MBQ4848599.1 hypothetical protein [Pseudoalteromonas sp. MMG012]MBQ4861194.1 hypothetical protein [Pseudoalteromonas sp. MMG013]